MLKITFEFVGGPKDGVSLESTLGDASDAERYYLLSLELEGSSNPHPCPFVVRAAQSVTAPIVHPVLSCNRRPCKDFLVTRRVEC